MTLKEREKEHIVYVLHKTHWDLEKTAHVLRIPLHECTQKLREYGLEIPENQNSSHTDTPGKTGAFSEKGGKR